jgi:UDP-N-acetylmuramoyl-tripeptide--D-alanyl-D-alanine ligase
MKRYTWKDISSWLDTSYDEKVFSEPPTGISCDSKKVQHGGLFIALPGAKTDGHLFLEEAYKAGAKAFVCKKGFSGRLFGVPTFFVDDTLAALQHMGKMWLSRSSAKVIGLTGSLGKTTTKGFLYSLLKTKYRVATTSGSKNSQIGLSLALLNETEGDEEFLILEMGMSEAGHIKKLIDIAPPDIALVTYVALVHSENFTTLEEIARAKAEIFSHPKTSLSIVNKDSECGDLLFALARGKRESYSVRGHPDATWRLFTYEGGLELVERTTKVFLPAVKFLAPHVYMNLLGAISCARTVGISFREIAEILPTLRLPERRLEKVEKRGITFINDAYNAAELSMKGALDAISKFSTGGRKIAVLGHMMELGHFSKECHKRVGEYALDKVDMLFCLGVGCGPLVDVWKVEGRKIEWYTDIGALKAHLLKELRQGDVVLLKGSRSLALEGVLEAFS